MILQGPQILRSQVRHQRISPRAHGFQTGAVALLMPIHALGPQPEGNWAWGWNRPGLLSVLEAEHGDGRTGLADWALAQLTAAGVHQRPHALWLMTFPRVLGYSFKPVSFWLALNEAEQPFAVIAEVNNTFRDRHIYVLDCQPGYRNGQVLRTDKAFYVSPFLPIEGHYEFRFFWPSSAEDRFLARIEWHHEGRMVLSTSISGRPEPLTKARALLAWLRFPAHSLMVMAQIHWHALWLWAKGIPFHARTSS